MCNGTFPQILRAAGITSVLGTPCGILAPLWTELSAEFPARIIPREDNAIAIAAGLVLGGQLPVVLMQNSGFAQSINVFASLIIAYQLPILSVISLRGTDIDHTEENITMGRSTNAILDCIGIKHREYSTCSSREFAQWARQALDREKRPAAITVAPTDLGWKP